MLVVVVVEVVLVVVVVLLVVVVRLLVFGSNLAETFGSKRRISFRGLGG